VKVLQLEVAAGAAIRVCCKQNSPYDASVLHFVFLESVL
jgi:hypothetical protein